MSSQRCAAARMKVESRHSRRSLETIPSPALQAYPPRSLSLSIPAFEARLRRPRYSQSRSRRIAWDGRYPTDFTVPSRRAQTPVHLPKDLLLRSLLPLVSPVAHALVLGVDCRWIWMVPHTPSRLYVVLWTHSCRPARGGQGVMCSRVDPDVRCSSPLGLYCAVTIALPRPCVGVARAANRLLEKSPALLGWNFYPLLNLHAVANGFDSSSSAYAHF
jgi:hypothetical protein